MTQLFLAQSGQRMISGIPDYFSLNFDWQMTATGIFGRTNTPRTIYVKTDYLPFFVDQVIPQLNSEFILITACSDYSPEINFNREYNILLNSSKVKYWYMNNMKTKTEKTSSLPIGLGSAAYWNGCTEESLDKILIESRNNVNKEKKISDKIFCCFRNRTFNVCGDDMIIRPKILELIRDRTDLFDFYDEDSLDFPNYLKTLSKYKYSLCPHGNGMDPNPSALISLCLYTTPIIYSTVNSIDIYKDNDSVIFFEKFEELLDNNIMKDKPEINFEFLTNKYWADKINSLLVK
jgi:hypothetical protein